MTRYREDNVPFDVDVVARGGHAIDAMTLGCDRRGRAQATSTRRSRSIIGGEDDGEDDGRRDDDGDAVPSRRSIIVLVNVPCPWMVNLTSGPSIVDRRR